MKKFMTMGIAAAFLASALVIPAASPANAVESASCYGRIYGQSSTYKTCVVSIQRIINAMGNNSLVADGIYGARTAEEVSRVQRGWSLTDDGVVGPATWDVLCYPRAATAAARKTAQCLGA